MSEAALADVLTRASDVVQSATELAERASDLAARPVLPVVPSLSGVLPDAGLRKGSTISVTGSTSLLLALIAEVTQRGSWAAVVGVPDLGLVAADELGVVTHRVAMIPCVPHETAGDVIAALLDGFDIVAVAADHVLPRGQRGLTLARRLTARARSRAAVLLTIGAWPAADLTLQCAELRWEGLAAGTGYLRTQDALVTVRGRGTATRPKTVPVRLRGTNGPALRDDAPDSMATVHRLRA
jgi:hypothetical protein